MSDYTVIGSPKNRGFRVIWMLEELGLPYRLETELPRSDRVRSLNPLGKVPILLDGDDVLTDSVAILTYLADKHSAFTFPAGTIARARQDGRMQFVVDEMDSLLWTAAKHSFVLPEDKRVPDVKPSLKWEFSQSVKRFETLLGDGPYLMGAEMTIADILACHCGGWASVARFPVSSDVFRSYIDRLRARPAYGRAQAAG
jgi:glutathione S-transferase